MKTRAVLFSTSGKAFSGVCSVPKFGYHITYNSTKIIFLNHTTIIELNHNQLYFRKITNRTQYTYTRADKHYTLYLKPKGLFCARWNATVPKYY